MKETKELQYSPEILANQLKEGFGFKEGGLKYSNKFLVAAVNNAVGESTMKNYLGGKSKDAPRIDLLMKLCSESVRISMPPKLPENAPAEARKDRERIREKLGSGKFEKDTDGNYIVPMLNCDLSYLLEGHKEKRKAAADLRQITGLNESAYNFLTREREITNMVKELEGLQGSGLASLVNALSVFPKLNEFLLDLATVLSCDPMQKTGYTYSEKFEKILQYVRTIYGAGLGDKQYQYHVVSDMLSKLWDEPVKMIKEKEGTLTYEYAVPSNKDMVDYMTAETSIPADLIDIKQNVSFQYASIIVNDVYLQEERALRAKVSKQEAIQLFGEFLDGYQKSWKSHERY